jgi:starvation-inducible DNA-binding protein
MTKTISNSEKHSRTSNGKVSLNLATPSDLKPEGASEICEALRCLLADVFALYLKTKNFHWHMSGPSFRDFTSFLTNTPIRFSP